MTVSNWTEADSNRALEIWSDYQQHHELSEKAGQTAGIDPASGRIWFGESIQDVVIQRDADGTDALCFSCGSDRQPTIEKAATVDRGRYYRRWCSSDRRGSRR